MVRKEELTTTKAGERGGNFGARREVEVFGEVDENEPQNDGTNHPSPEPLHLLLLHRLRFPWSRSHCHSHPLQIRTSQLSHLPSEYFWREEEGSDDYPPQNDLNCRRSVFFFYEKKNSIFRLNLIVFFSPIIVIVQFYFRISIESIESFMYLIVAIKFFYHYIV